MRFRDAGVMPSKRRETLSIFGSIGGFAGFSPVAVAFAKSAGAESLKGTGVQQLLPSGADFAALVRALSSQSNADPEGNPVPVGHSSEPIAQLEETLEKIMGVPVTVEPLASIQDWGLFEIRLNDIPREMPPDGLAGSSGETADPPMAFLLAQMPAEAGASLPSYPNVPIFGRTQGTEGAASPPPMAFLIYPTESSINVSGEPLNDPHRSPGATGNADLRLVSQLSNTRIELPVPIESLTSTVTPDEATLPILADTTGQTISIDTPSNEALYGGPQSPDRAGTVTYTGLTNPSAAVPILPENLPLVTDANRETYDRLLGTEPNRKAMASNPPDTRSSATVLEGSPDKPGLAEVAKTLREQVPQTIIESVTVERIVPQKLVVPLGILEILKAGSPPGAPLSDGMKAPWSGRNGLDSAFFPSGKSPIASVNPNPASPPVTQPSSTAQTEIAAQLQKLAPEANPLSPAENPASARPGFLKLTSLSSQTKNLQLPAQILEGEPALKITSLVAKVFSQKTEAPAQVVAAKPDGKVDASPAEPKGPLAASIKPAVPENAAPVSKEPAPLSKPEASLKVPVLAKPIPEKAPALIAETEQRVARSLLSTLFSGNSRTQPQSSGTETRQVKENPDRAVLDKTPVSVALKPEANRPIDARRVEPPRPDPVADRQVESPVRTSPVSGTSSSVSAAPAASAPAPASGSSPSNSATQNLEVVQQVSQALQSHRAPAGSEIRVRLVPENLGEVHIKIAVKDGTLVAEIRASSEVTREILSRETHKIQAMLLDTGAKVEHVVVRTGGFGGEAFQSDRSNQRESNLPPDKEGGSHSGRDEKDTGSSHQEKERDPNSPWDRWEKFA